MIKKNISASAFLVNESRAKAEQLSLDSYAKLWVDASVRDLWNLFSKEVYLNDPQALAVRNRFFLGCLNRFFAENPQGVFINIAAGFTSYPYLMDCPVQAIEVDLPGVVEYKKKKVKEFREAGSLPWRDIAYVAADLNCPKGREALYSELSQKIRCS